MIDIRYNPMDVYSTLHTLQGGRCFYCDANISNESWIKGVRPKGFTKDHFLPKSRGHTLVGNVILACRKCNTRKSNRPPTQDEVEMFISIWEQVKHFDLLQKEAIAEYRATKKIIDALTRVFGYPIGIISHK